MYGYASPSRPTEVVNLRVTARGLTSKPALTFDRPQRAFTPKPAARRVARFAGRSMSTQFYRWDALVPGARGRAPAVITSGEATAVVPPGWHFQLDGFRNVILHHGR
jgi:N-methylhydantoinase A